MRAVLVAGLILLLHATTLRADLHCEQAVVDVGVVRNGESLSRRFVFINRSLVPIEVTDVRSTCGCLTPRLEKRVYEHGERGEVLLEVNTLALAPGRQSWRTRLIYRDANTVGELELTLVGEVRTEVLVQPAALTLPAEIGGHEITVTDFRAKPLTITRADAGDRLATRIGTSRTDECGRFVQTVRLDVPPDCPEGRHTLAVHVYTNDPQYRELTIPVTVVKKSRSRVTAAPAEVTLSGERGQPFPSRLVRLTAADGQEVEVEGIESDNPAVRATWVKGPGNAVTVKVQVDGTRLTNDGRATLRVKVVKPTSDVVMIPVTLLVR